ncbi:MULTISPECIES: hypothetical protein [Wolbachia]
MRHYNSNSLLYLYHLLWEVLYYAANNNHQELVELLLAHGASYDY